MGVRRLEVSREMQQSLSRDKSVSGLFHAQEPLCLVSKMELQRLEHIARTAETAREQWWRWLSAQGPEIEHKVFWLIGEAEKRLGIPISPLPHAESTSEGALTLTWRNGVRSLRVHYPAPPAPVEWSYLDLATDDASSLPGSFYEHLRDILTAEEVEEINIEFEPPAPKEATQQTRQ